MARATGGWAFASFGQSQAGPINSVTVQGVNPVNVMANVSIVAPFSVTAAFLDPQLGLTINFFPGQAALAVEGSYGFGATITNLQFNNGSVISLTGNLTFLGLPIPFTSGVVQDQANQQPRALQALGQLSSVLGGCAAGGN